MSWYRLNLGKKQISSSRQYKVIKLKIKTAKVLIWAIIIFSFSLLFINQSTWMFFSIGALLLILISLSGLLYAGLLDFSMLKLSRAINRPKKKTKYIEIK